jgi:hypothetical protein
MRIKITEEQYNNLINEGYFDRLGAKVSSGINKVKGFGSNIKNTVTGTGGTQNLKDLGGKTKLNSIGTAVNKKVEDSIKDLEKLFPSANRSEQVGNYMYFLKEFLGTNNEMLGLEQKGLSKNTNLFFNKKTNQTQPTQTQATPNQTQPTQGVQNKQTPNQTQPTQTNYPGRTEELRQKMQSKLNPNPYYGK